MLNLLITCVNYSDYLESTLIYNINNFDNIYIVTTTQDVYTHNTIQALNIKNNIRVINTNIFFEDGPWGKTYFNKGGAINFALSQIEQKDWLLIGDADIIYPSKIKDELSTLNIDVLYGMYRYKVYNKTNMLNIIENQKNQIDNQYLNEAIAHYGMRRHGIVGYCQLFNFNSIRLKDNLISYPQGSSARYVDTRFSKHYFPRKYRALLNKYCLHLGPTCVNWTGRKSEQWK